jgi:hypothetical protein
MGKDKKIAAAAQSKSEAPAKKSLGEHPAFKTPERPNPGTVMSRLDHDITISYEGMAMVIPPRGKIPVADTQKLGALPTGVQVVKG